MPPGGRAARGQRCAYWGRMPTAELANRVPSLLGTSPSPTNRPPRCARRSDVHEEASVKTGARRLRDFPDIPSASSALAERHESVYGRSHSIPRRRDAPRRTSGCDLGPATDLDLDDLLLRRACAPRTGVPLAFANML